MGLSADEQVLLDGCRGGDNKAWLALYRAYGGDVGTFLKGMLRYSNDIDDLVQRVFLEFLSSLERFRGDASLRTWLLRIARNVALHEIRSKSRRQHYVRAYAETVELRSSSPEGQVHARKYLRVIQSLLGTLDDSFREVWVLRELGECTVAETAAIMEIPEATVRTRHYRARRRLFELLRELDEGDAKELARPAPNLKLVSSKGGPSGR